MLQQARHGREHDGKRRTLSLQNLVGGRTSTGSALVPGCNSVEKGANMQRRWVSGFWLVGMLLCLAGCAKLAPDMKQSFASYTLDYDTPVDAALQGELEALDARLRAKYGMSAEQTAVGVLDLQRLRLAMLRPDHEEYAASVPKIGILLAYFELHPEAATNLDAQTRHEFGLMIKVSSNEMAAKYSRALGLREIQRVLDSDGFYDAKRGGGLWMGKHYGQGGERIGSPAADNSHAATARQLLRFYLLLEQEKLVSPAASRTMREIFASPDIRHDENKFVKGLAGREVQILRKSGTWENWLHDTAVVTGRGRHYIVVALTRHPKGDDYLVDLARAVDDRMSSGPTR
jgi:beta-lactamase class A